MNLMPNCKNTKIQGSIGLGQAIACFTKLGYIVSVPLNDSQDYDLIVEIDNKLYKVQVKRLRGNSSVGRAPALQAGGRGFESHFFHHFYGQAPESESRGAL